MFGTGVKGLNYTGDTVADMLRLNYSIPVTPAARVNRLGVIGGDNGGFPNGRRLGDDVVDAAERVMAGFLKGNKVELGDGVNAGDVPNLAAFPYEAQPRLRVRQRQGRPEALSQHVRGSGAGRSHARIEPAVRSRRIREGSRVTTEGVGKMKSKILAAGAVSVAALAAVAAAFVGPGPDAGTASSHREAPLISEDPVADNTDVYAFVSPDRPDTVTILANYIPLEEPAGGPNFNGFGDNVLYEIKIDNTGDGDEDISYQFRFRTETRNPNTFLYNTGPIDTLSDTDWNRPQFYSVTRVEGRRGGGIVGVAAGDVLAQNLPTPPVNIGPRSTPNYGSLMGAAVHDLPGGGKVFAGQIDDPFFVDLGSVFDLAGLRPFNPAHAIPLPAENGVDGVGGYNTHTIALQVPIAQLTKDRAVPTGPERSGRRARRLRQREQAARPGARREGRAEVGRRLRAGLAAREPARQRGRDPARQEGPLERVRSVRRRGLPRPSTSTPR